MGRADCIRAAEMTVEPGDYDLRELRRMADEEDPPLDVPGESGEEAFRTGQREELMKLQTQFMSSGRLPEKPYLESLPTRYGAEVSPPSGTMYSSRRRA